MPEYPAASDTASDTVGFTLDGILHEMVFVPDPMEVSPLYVVMVNVIFTDVPVVFWLANVNGGVNEILVAVDFVHIVPLALPQVYVIVCVKLVDCLVTVNVCAVPSVPLPTDKVDFLGMVVSAWL